MSFARRELKYEPCAQSWKMMKMRTSNAPDRTANGTVSHSDTSSAQYIAYHKSAYGARVFVSCQSARLVEAW